MRGFGRSAGFTLMEVGLAITVGTVLAAAGVMAYMHARDAAGDSVARQKVADLQIMVEDYHTRFNALPPLGGGTTNNLGLRDMWFAARSDTLKSPWGGDVVNSRFGVEGLDGVVNPVPPSPTDIGGPKNLCFTRDTSGGELCGNAKNNLIYHRYQLPASTPAPCCWNLWDAGLKTYVPAYGYAVAINKNGRTFYFVTSGRTAP